MTITSTINRVSIDGDGETTTFSFPHRFLQPSDLVVILRTNATKVDVVQTLGTHYRVTGEGDATGGSVIFDIIEDGEPIDGETVIIYNDPGITQGTDYIAGGTFSAESHETALDLLTLQQQRTRDIANRKLGLGEGDTDGSGEYDANLNKIVNLTTPTANADAANKNYVDSTVTNTVGPIPTGSSFVTATGSTTARTLASRWANVFNVMDYGATGNGTDETTEIQAAIDAARNSSYTSQHNVTASMIVFPYTATGYGITGLTFYSGQHLVGMGRVKLIQTDDANVDAMLFADGEHDNNHKGQHMQSVVENLTLIGNAYSLEITGVSKGTTTVITAGNNLANGDSVFISYVVDSAPDTPALADALNGNTFTVSSVSSSQFTINLNSSSIDPNWSSGGLVNGGAGDSGKGGDGIRLVEHDNNVIRNVHIHEAASHGLYGAKKVARTATDGAFASLGTTFTSAAANFINSDVGSTITINGAATGGDGVLRTSIVSKTNENTVVLALASGSGLSYPLSSLTWTISAGSKSDGLTLADVFVSNAKGKGIYAGGNSHYWSLNNCRVVNNFGHNLYLSGPGMNVFGGVIGVPDGGVGAEVYNVSGGGMFGLEVEATSSVTSASIGVKLGDNTAGAARGYVLQGCVFTFSGSTDSSNSCKLLQIDQAQECVVTGGHFDANMDDDITFIDITSRATDCVIDNAMFGGNAGGGNVIPTGKGYLDAGVNTIINTGPERLRRKASFLVTADGSQTNITIGSYTVVTWANEIFDLGGDFTGNAFTAPVTGKYQLSWGLRLSHIDNTATEIAIQINASNRAVNFTIDPRNFATNGSAHTLSNSVDIDMDAADTVNLRISITGGGSTVDVTATNSFFSGYLIAG